MHLHSSALSRLDTEQTQPNSSSQFSAAGDHPNESSFERFAFLNPPLIELPHVVGGPGDAGSGGSGGPTRRGLLVPGAPRPLICKRAVPASINVAQSTHQHTDTPHSRASAKYCRGSKTATRKRNLHTASRRPPQPPTPRYSRQVPQAQPSVATYCPRASHLWRRPTGARFWSCSFHDPCPFAAA